MTTDPFEEFRKKKFEVKKSTAKTDDKYYDIPTEGTGGTVSGMVTHRFSSSDVEVKRPEGFEATELGNALKDPKPDVPRPKGFESYMPPEDDA